MKKILSILLVLGLLTPLTLVYSQETDPVEETPDETAQITVYTQTNSGNRIEGINVTVSNDGYNQSKNTDIQGKAIFDELSPATYTIIINLTGSSKYELVSGESVTKERVIEAGETEDVYFGLKLKNTDEGTDDSEVEDEEVTINIPSNFTSNGAETTQLNNRKMSELKNMEQFTLEIKNRSKIMFQENIDLSKEETINKLNKLSNYVFMDVIGEVTIASDLIPELDKPARVYFYDLNFVRVGDSYTPLIVKDDQETNDITNIKLVDNDEIQFDVEGFSTYSVRPTLYFEQDEIQTKDFTYVLTGQVDDLDSTLAVYLNEERYEFEDPISVNEDGSFEIPINLEDGENIIQIIATGVSEQTNAKTLTIVRTDEEAVEEPIDESDGINVLFIVLAIIVLAGAVGGGYWYYNKSKKNSKPKISNTIGAKYDSRLLTPEERKDMETTRTPRPKM